MLFNSYVFIFLFLPLTLLGYVLLGRTRSHPLVAFWLVLASLTYYGWWGPKYVLLFLVLIVFNYGMGNWLIRETRDPRRRLLLAFGIVVNLAVLLHYKYTNFVLNTVNTLTGANYAFEKIVLPLGISFFTFQKIAYLVDAYRHEVKKYTFLDFCLFVTFFPQLIAGPIVHHKEILSQFANRTSFRLKSTDVAVGLTVFAIGLFKKVMLADSVAIYANPIFDAAHAGTAPTFFEAWLAAIAYTLQLYFDFSGYTDMAIGMGRLFSIRLPLNFHSPYKSANITEFWRRWHMTLSRFLRDYLYIPLGGNRKGPTRRYVNLMATMLLGGLWHGAGWTFVVWGGLHGLYLCLNHAWQAWRGPAVRPTWYGTAAGVLLTNLAVVVAWVFFRATDFHSAFLVLKGMAGGNGLSLGWSGAESRILVSAWVMALVLFVWFLPNTQQLLARYRPAFDFHRVADDRAKLQDWLRWRPVPAWAVLTGVAAAVAIVNLSKVMEFIYYQF